MGVLAVALSACGTTKWGFPYRADVQQGNWVTSEQVSRLEKGMTREQVRYILGTPTLQDIFHASRWDYPYYNKPGYGKEEERRFTVWFENDVLTRWDGDQQPDRQPFQKADTGAGSTAVSPAGADQAAPAASDAARAGAAPSGPAQSGSAEPGPIQSDILGTNRIGDSTAGGQAADTPLGSETGGGDTQPRTIQINPSGPGAAGMPSSPSAPQPLP